MQHYNTETAVANELNILLVVDYLGPAYNEQLDSQKAVPVITKLF